MYMSEQSLNKLTTPYEAVLDKEKPFWDYPRPQLVRDSYISLNGKWDFAIGKNSDIPNEYSEKILVPFPPESRLSGIERTHAPEEFLFYRRSFTIPEGFIKNKLLLHFGAVDQLYTLYINGKLIYDGVGGYLPTVHDITDAVAEENEIVVCVKDELSHTYPWGKQRYDRGGMWYTPVSGIWQSVWLESVCEDFVIALKITPTAESVNIKVSGGKKKKKITLKSGEVYEFDGEEIDIYPKEPKAWTPETPHLYYFTLESGEDRVESYFALRTIEIGEWGGVKRILLNGKPYFFNALLDQGYYPDGIFLPATSAGYEGDIMLAKSLGFNTLRKHIKIEPMVFYHLCDKLGMVVFQDMVNNSDYSFIRDTALPTVGLKRLSDKNLHKNKESREVFISTMRGTIEHLYNTPSVLYYTIFNEGWGQFTADEVYTLAKSQDKTRIYDATSGWFTQKLSDVDSHHIYFKRVKLKTPSPRPIVISEFGGYSHRVDGHLFGAKNYGYRTFDTKEALEAALIELYRNEIKPYVKGGLSAAVLTQISDVEDETNGLITYDRQVVKVRPEVIRRVMDEIISEID